MPGPALNDLIYAFFGGGPSFNDAEYQALLDAYANDVNAVMIIGAFANLADPAANGWVMTSNGDGTAEFKANGGGGGGTPVAIENEGTPLTAQVAMINFVGLGVHATESSDNVTVTIPGGVSGLLAARPAAAAANAGMVFYATDTRLIYFSDGSTWTTVVMAASTIHIVDALNLYTSTDVEGALQEIDALGATAEIDLDTSTPGLTVIGVAGTLTNKTLVTPTIASFVNAGHNHSNAAGGGTIAHSVLTGLTSGDPHTQYVLESVFDAAGDLLIGTGSDTLARLARGTEGQLLRASASTVEWGGAVDVQVFTASGTYTPPVGATYFEVFIIHTGSAGGSGRRGAAGTVRGGGGGGQGGPGSFASYTSAQVTGAQTITIPAGPAGGAAPTGNDSDGANGASLASRTSFGSLLLVGTATGTTSNGKGAVGTARGLAGGDFSTPGDGLFASQQVGNLPSAATGVLSAFVGGVGGDGTTAATGSFTTFTGGGGAGGGAGISAANAAATPGGNGGSGGNGYVNAAAGAGGASGVDGADGGDGSNTTVNRGGGGGGGGGASTTAVASGRGGDGGIYGGAGGGGGAQTNGATGGRGGNGAGGIVIVVAYR